MAMKLFSFYRGSDMRMAGIAFLAVLFSVTTTYAGFEWVPGQPAPVVAVESAPSPAPVPPAQELLMQEPQPLNPLPYEPTPMPDSGPVIKVKSMGASSESAPISQSAQQRVILPDDAPETARSSLAINPFPQGKPAAVAPAPEIVVPPTVTANEQQSAEQAVVGFGTDMPLALALQQIAPPGYAFSFGESVNPGAKVSWTGGKPWIEVMNEMIAPLGLQASVRGKVIFVHNERHSAVAPSENLIEPSAGGQGMADPTVLLPEDMVDGMRRQNVQDPGIQGKVQPQETIAALDKRALESVNDIREPQSQEQVWEAEAGDSLKQTLQKWGKTGNFNIDWQAMHDFTVQSDILVAGQINKALKTLVTDGLNATEKPTFTFVKNQDEAQNSTLIIQDPQNTSL